jgi:hypothetical protein
MASRNGSSEATPAASAPSLPLELAGPFYDTATLVAVSRTTKGCAASKMLAAQWADVFSRRFPCLAALPAFAAPLADAKALVKWLLTATPVPPEPPRRGRSRGGGSLLPPAPRDGEGRALPLRETVILAAQLAVRGDTALTHRPLLFGHRRMADVDDPTDDGAFGGPCWRIDIPLAAVGDGSRQMKTSSFEHFCRVNAAEVAQQLGIEENDPDVRSALHDAWIDLGSDGRLACAAAAPSVQAERNIYGVSSIRDALSLPESFTADFESDISTALVLRSLLEGMCRAADRELRQDIFVVAGQDVWRMDSSEAFDSSSNLEDTTLALADGNFLGSFYAIRNGDDRDTPWLPLEVLVDNVNLAMSTEWGLGRYGWRGDTIEEPLHYSTDRENDLTLALCAWWEGLLADNIVAEHATTNTDDDDGHPYLCQLLAATRPVRVARAPTAA